MIAERTAKLNHLDRILNLSSHFCSAGQRKMLLAFQGQRQHLCKCHPAVDCQDLSCCHAGSNRKKHHRIGDIFRLGRFWNGIVGDHLV